MPSFMRSHIQNMPCWAGFFLAFVLTNSLVGQNAGQLDAAHAIVSAIPAADVPARCAELLAGAPVFEQAAVAASLVSAVSKHHAASLTATMLGMSSRVPRIAPAIAAAAIESQPETAARVVASLATVPGVHKSDVVSAAISAAPGQAAQCFQAKASRRQNIPRGHASKSLATASRKSTPI